MLAEIVPKERAESTPGMMPPSMRRFSWGKSYAVVAAISVLVMGALIALSPRGFFSGDEGVKLVQVQSVAARGFTGDALIYPGERFDPDWRHFPLPPPFVVGRGTERHSIYSPLFAAVSVPGWLGGRYVGTLFVPAAGAVACALLAMHLARRAGHGPGLSAFAGVATLVFAPVAAYGATFTEHTLGVALALAAFVLVDREPPRWLHLAGAGACVGVGAILRTELLVLAPALALFCALRWGLRPALVWRLAIVGAAAAACFGAYVARNLLVLDVWNPAVLANETANRRTSLREGLPMLLPLGVRDVLGLHPWVPLAAAVGLGALAWVRGWARLVWIAAGAATLFLWGWVCVAGAAAIFAEKQRAWSGVVAATPLALVGVLTFGRGPRRTEGALVLAALVYIAGVFFTNVDKSAGGLQIGARHMLPAVPLLLIGVLPLLAETRRFWLLVAPVVALSAVASAAQLKTLVRMKRFHGDIAAKVFSKKVPDVVTTFFWGGQVLAEGYADHRIYMSPGAGLLSRLRAAGVERVVQALGAFRREDLPRLALDVDDERDGVAVVYRLRR
jgi:hypothetical protein